MESLGVEMSQNSHLDVAQETGTQGQKKTQTLLAGARLCLGLLPSPEERQESCGYCQEHFHTHTARVPPKYR